VRAWREPRPHAIFYLNGPLPIAAHPKFENLIKSRRDGMLVENHGHDGQESHRDDTSKMMILHAIPPGFLLIPDRFSTNISSRWDFPPHIRNLKIQ
jgi:hypothetical protein